jgi:hypothetical protein
VTLATTTVDSGGNVVAFTSPQRVVPDISMVGDRYSRAAIVGETFPISTANLDRQTFSRKQINHGQRTDLATIREPIRNKIHSPDFIRASGWEFLQLGEVHGATVYRRVE